MKEGKYTKILAKIQVKNIPVYEISVPKDIEVETPCWWQPGGQQHCRRKPAKTSVTEFWYESVLRNSCVLYHKTKNPFEANICMKINFQLL